MGAALFARDLDDTLGSGFIKTFQSFGADLVEPPGAAECSGFVSSVRRGRGGSPP
jgi:hypothetical protein